MARGAHEPSLAVVTGARFFQEKAMKQLRSLHAAWVLVPACITLATALAAAAREAAGPQPVRPGTERWAIKTGGDARAGQIPLPPFSPTPDTTIPVLGALHAPAQLPAADRLPAERTAHTVDAYLTAFKLETDGDYHLVIRDPHSAATMIAEIPRPDFMASGTPWHADVATVRQAFQARFLLREQDLSDPGFRVLLRPVPIRISGVVFFDVPHGQRGAAPNQVELHPVVRLLFGPPARNPG